jgi:hypothetical protein
MTIPSETAAGFIQQVGESGFLAHLQAQTHARYVLLQLHEDPDNFPEFNDNLDEQITHLAYALLAAGCSLVESEQTEASREPLFSGATLLHQVNGPAANKATGSDFHSLVAGMAFYACGHYSRAYLAIANASSMTSAGLAIREFLRRDLNSVVATVNSIILGGDYVDGYGDSNEAALDIPGRAITVLIARALHLAIEFAIDGRHQYLEQINLVLTDALSLAANAAHPGWWWCARLLRLMLTDLGDASPWTILPPHFPTDSHNGLARYVRGLTLDRRPAIELWESQRKALPCVLDDDSDGVVLSLRTSAGKTRVAEIAILKAVLSDDTAKVLYVAPYRSLAWEVEDALERSFAPLGVVVSHLYGGAQVSGADVRLADEAAVVVATPEKARALLRAQPEFLDKVKLVVLDEGHLIGLQERHVRNELFLHELTVHAVRHGAKILLLSAVLPNVAEVAEWIAGSPDASVESDWRPSGERLGTLTWNGRSGRIDWRGTHESFNPSFVRSQKIKWGGRRKPFPSDANEAVAAAALRLSEAGPVLVFTGNPSSVGGIAKSVLIAMGQHPEKKETPRDEWRYAWPSTAWQRFLLACEECLGEGSIEARAAEYGIICHSGKLLPDVRMATERLMRSKPPRIIIATTTLAQGVNVGVSTVLIANPWIAGKSMPVRDFWNLAGRAGRAFVDDEGRILVLINADRSAKEAWQIRKARELADKYLGRDNLGQVESGILGIVRFMRHVARKAGVSFDYLVELIAENDFGELGEDRPLVEYAFDLIDDGLLSLFLSDDIDANPEAIADWVESVFRKSLAVIQAERDTGGVSGDDVLAVLRARVTANSASDDDSQRVVGIAVRGGIAIRAARMIDDQIDQLASDLAEFAQDSDDFEEMVSACEALEALASRMPSSVIASQPDKSVLDDLRECWLRGESISPLIARGEQYRKAIAQFYGFELPWITYAVACRLRAGDHDEEATADAIETLATHLELGLPDELSIRIYLCGIRSRGAAVEIADILRSAEVQVPGQLGELRRLLLSPATLKRVIRYGSEGTRRWLELLDSRGDKGQRADLQLAGIRIKQPPKVDRLVVRGLGDEVYYCSPDLTYRLRARKTADRVADAVNNLGVCFEPGDHPKEWEPVVRDPRRRLAESGDEDRS